MRTTVATSDSSPAQGLLDRIRFSVVDDQRPRTAAGFDGAGRLRLLAHVETNARARLETARRPVDGQPEDHTLTAGSAHLPRTSAACQSKPVVALLDRTVVRWRPTEWGADVERIEEQRCAEYHTRLGGQQNRFIAAAAVGIGCNCTSASSSAFDGTQHITNNETSHRAMKRFRSYLWMIQKLEAYWDGCSSDAAAVNSGLVYFLLLTYWIKTSFRVAKSTHSFRTRLCILFHLASVTSFTTSWHAEFYL